MRRRGIKELSPAALAQLPTTRLLAFRDRLLSAEESLEASDCEATEIDPSQISFKNDPRWIALYGAVLAELARRPRVPRGL